MAAYDVSFSIGDGFKAGFDRDATTKRSSPSFTHKAS